MKAELKQKWVAALRSGKYTQGHKQLRTVSNEYCCLGVLCDVFDNSKWKKFYFCYSYDTPRNTNFLPNDLLKEVGRLNERQLVKMNDIYMANFIAIADYIEREIPTDEK
jgi:hypothetical protein